MLNLATQRFQALYRSNPRDWTDEQLMACTQDELTALCKLLGVAHSGTKAKQIARMLDMVALRTELATWPEVDSSDQQMAWTAAGEISKRYSRPQLVKLAQRADLYYSVPKAAIVIALLNWRATCRQRGQQFDAELRAARTERPAQIVMRLT